MHPAVRHPILCVHSLQSVVKILAAVCLMDNATNLFQVNPASPLPARASIHRVVFAVCFVQNPRQLVLRRARIRISIAF